MKTLYYIEISGYCGGSYFAFKNENNSLTLISVNTGEHIGWLKAGVNTYHKYTAKAGESFLHRDSVNIYDGSLFQSTGQKVKKDVPFFFQITTLIKDILTR